MKDKYCYYIAKNARTQTQFYGFKIFKRLSKLPILIANTPSFDGPYGTIKALQKFSPLAQELKASSLKEYIKVIRNENIVEIHTEIKVPKKGYSSDFIKMFSHGIKPKVGKSVSGGHTLLSKSIRIKEKIAIDRQGVIKAIIEAKNLVTDKWIEKSAITTLFPENWDHQKYFEECEFANNHKEKIGDNIYKSYTRCGIETRIICRNNILTSFYPIFSET